MTIIFMRNLLVFNSRVRTEFVTAVNLRGRFLYLSRATARKHGRQGIKRSKRKRKSPTGGALTSPCRRGQTESMAKSRAKRASGASKPRKSATKAKRPAKAGAKAGPVKLLSGGNPQ